MSGAGLDRREVLGKLFPDPARYLMVAGLAGSAAPTPSVSPRKEPAW